MKQEPSSYFMSAMGPLLPKAFPFPSKQEYSKAVVPNSVLQKIFQWTVLPQVMGIIRTGENSQWPCKFLQRFWHLGAKPFQRTSSRVAVHRALAKGTRDLSLFVSQSTEGGIRNYPRVFFRQPYLRKGVVEYYASHANHKATLITIHFPLLLLYWSLSDFSNNQIKSDQ